MVTRLNQLFLGSGLMARSARGALSLAVGTGFEKGFRFVRSMFLTRLLAPEFLGQMAVIMSCNYFLEAIAEVGIKQAIIQSKHGLDKDYLNMAWFFQAVRGIVLYIAGFVLAPLIASFYKQPELALYIRFAFLAIFLRSILSPRAHVLEKQFHFFKSVLLIQGSGLIGSLVTVILAFTLRNIWALLIGMVAEYAIMFLFSFLLCPFLPRFHFHRGYFLELFHFARGMFAVPLLTFVAFEADVLIGGRLVNMVLMGWYSMARQLARMPREYFGAVIGPVMLPAFSEKQDDLQSLIYAIDKISMLIGLFMIPLMTGMALYAVPILSVIWGPDFAAVSIPFAMLCFCIYLRIQGMPLASLYLALGKPHIQRYFVAIRSFILIPLLIVMTRRYALAGMAASVLLAEGIGILCQVFVLRRFVGIRFWGYLYSWIPGVLVAAGMLFATWFLGLYFRHSTILSLVEGLILGAGAWSVSFLWMVKAGLLPAKVRTHATSEEIK